MSIHDQYIHLRRAQRPGPIIFAVPLNRAGTSWRLLGTRSYRLRAHTASPPPPPRQLEA